MHFKGLTAPKWDEKDDTAPMYIEKVEALVEVYGIGDALDQVQASTLPTKTVVDGLDDTSDSNIVLRNLWSANQQISAIYTLGQESLHGFAA